MRDNNIYDDTNERFRVFQFFEDGSYEEIRRDLGAREAVETAYFYCTNVAANVGITRRVIVVDSGDYTNFEWRYGIGVTYPTRDMIEENKRLQEK